MTRTPRFVCIRNINARIHFAVDLYCHRHRSPNTQWLFLTPPHLSSHPGGGRCYSRADIRGAKAVQRPRVDRSTAFPPNLDGIDFVYLCHAAPVEPYAQHFLFCFVFCKKRCHRSIKEKTVMFFVVQKSSCPKNNSFRFSETFFWGFCEDLKT